MSQNLESPPLVTLRRPSPSPFTCDVIYGCPLISCFADSHSSTHIVDSSAKAAGWRVFALGWLIPGANCAENRQRSLHIVSQETINLNATG